MEINLLVMLALLLLGGMVFYSFVCWTVRRGLRDCERAYSDADFREERVAALNRELAGENSGDAKKAEKFCERARLHVFAGRISAALADAETYTRLRPGDSEGWAELGEYALIGGRAGTALDAARRALALRETDDYRALALRACLYLKDLDGAARELSAWETLDAARVANPPQPHRWSLFAQMPPAKVVRDPALDYYRAVLTARRGDCDAARRINAALAEDNPGYHEAVHRARWQALLAPVTLSENAAVPLFPEEARAEALARAAAQGVYAVTLTIPAAMEAAENARIMTALRAMRENLTSEPMPQIITLLCPDQETYDYWRREFLLRED